ncbi:ATP-binding cassette domain-containing protein [Pseudobdellovibrio exovorus]|uniref:ABC transporter domain-containing protein n=1 Tax=Pseudobdellovibrio exovorus JSS TaxID=1184267 RepID=M4V599_9BACT|nr:ATP-binding cassette domain-containing protein [Pseudobdellovibrio exovorus]AGH94497.1 hypothetical protein A11Q_277 [Pseudobdellovibrio exovorus JSS]
MSSIITAHQVSYELPNGLLLFENVSFSLDSKITALVGPNGVGKTCLSQLLCGELEPSSGRIIRKGIIRYFPQRQTPPPISVDEFLASESGSEAEIGLATGFESDLASWSITRESLLSPLKQDLLKKDLLNNSSARPKLCTELSGGQWMRVRLAKALGAGFLVLDEPTNDLDRDGREALLDFLCQRQQWRTGGVLLISHDRECLNLCEDVLELSNRGLSKFGMSWNEYLLAKEQERQALQRQLDVSTRERNQAAQHRHDQIERQEKRNRQGSAAGARGGLPKILLGARKRKAQATTAKLDVRTLDKANAAVRSVHEALSQIKVDPMMYADLLGQPLPEQKLIAEARNFNLRFSNSSAGDSTQTELPHSGWLYAEDLNFIWRGNLRLALKGPNGSGKSTLLKELLTGTDDAQGSLQKTNRDIRGELRKGQLRTLYIDQRCSFLKDDLSILENIREHAVADESEIRNNLAKFLFTKDKVFQTVQSLSGGERLRAALACGFMQEQAPELLILDEPTNNLDLANVEFLENLIQEFRGALVVISHDEVFLKNCGVTEEFDLSDKRVDVSSAQS